MHYALQRFFASLRMTVWKAFEQPAALFGGRRISVVEFQVLHALRTTEILRFAQNDGMEGFSATWREIGDNGQLTTDN
jgi:hypothetical protein